MILRLIRSLISAYAARSRVQFAKKIKQRRWLLSQAEMLEDRRMFAVNAIVATDDIAPVVGTFSTTTSTNDNQLAIAIQTSDKNSVADISLFANNGIATLVRNFENVPTDGSGTALINTPTLTDGNYFIRARSGEYAKWFFTCDKGLANYEAQQTLNFSVDTKLPVPVITSPLSNFTNATNIPITVTFSEPVQGFTAGNIAVTNGSVSSPITRRAAQDFATTFSFNVTPTKQGPLTIKIVSDAAHDIAFNDNVPSNFFKINYDNTPPVLNALSPVPFNLFSTPTNSDRIEYRVQFSEPIRDISTDDFTLTGTTARVTDITGNGYSTYILGVSGGDLANLNSTINLTLSPTQNIIDLAGNPLSSQTPATGKVFIDNSAPVLQSFTRLNAANQLTNANILGFRATFSESVKNVDAADFNVTGTTASIVLVNQVSATDFYIDISGGDLVNLNGVVGLKLNAGQNITDRAGNALPTVQPPIAETYTLDNTRPTVQITSTATSPTNASPIPVTVTFSEAVSRFGAGDIVLTNAKLNNFTFVSDTTFTLSLTPLADGLVTVAVPANVATDLAGNFNRPARTLSILSDRTSPTTTLTTTTVSPTSAAQFTVTVFFSEFMSGFQATDVVVTNGTITHFAIANSQIYKIIITPTADGPVTVNVPANGANDAAGNGNLAAAPITIISDRTPPKVTGVNTITTPTSLAQIPVRLTFSEPVIGFVAADMLVANGTVNGFKPVGATSYDFDVTPNADGPITIDVPSAVTNDAAGNGNLASAPITLISDRTPPRITLSSTAPSPTNLNQIPVTLKLSEPLKNFVATDVFISNGNLSNFSKVDATTYTFDVAPVLDGSVTINVPAAVQSDLAGNKNLAATPLIIVSDRTNPTVTIASTAVSPTNLAAIPVTVTFSENVTGFTATDVQLINGAISNFTAVNGTTYTFDVTPLVSAKTSGGGGGSKGLVTISVPAGAADDTAGNFNLVATPLSIISDRSSPTVALTTTVTSPTNAAVIPVTVTFSEAVTGFALTDVTPTNATLSNFVAVNATTYTFDVTPIADGTVTINLPANVAVDTAGNNNVAAVPLIIASDRIPPNATMTTTASNPTNLSVIPVTVKFNEPVTGFALTDVTPTNATLSNFIAVNATTYTFDVTPIADGAVTINVPAAVATDLAGNSSQAASTLSLTSDRTAPTPVITTTVSTPTTTTVIPVTVTFTENVVGFAATDVVLVNGSLSNFKAVNGSTYTFDVTPIGPGKLTIDVPAAAANDVAGNASLAASTLSLVVASPLTATLTYVPAAIGATALGKVDIVFSAPVTGLDTSDLVLLVNGSPFNLGIDLLSGTGASYTLNLSSLPLSKGNYSITLLHLNTGIVDSTNNALLQDVVTSWIV